MKKEFQLVLAFVLFGCTSIHYEYQEAHYEYQKATIADLRDGFKEKATITPKDTITTSIEKDTLLREQHIYFINTQTADVVEFNGYNSPSLVAQLDQPSSQITIKSYVVKPDNGERYLFYPVITAFDSSLNKIAEIYPLYEFVFSENTLTNTFKLPSKSKYILIHSKPEFLGMEFMDSSSENPTASENPTDLSGPVAVLGGAIGSVIYAYMSHQQIQEDINDNTVSSFSFASGGAISWSAN